MIPKSPMDVKRPQVQTSRRIAFPRPSRLAGDEAVAAGPFKAKYHRAGPARVDRWNIAGVLLILVGVTILALLSGFIVDVIVKLLKLLAVFVGILLILGGVALLTGRRFMRRRKWGWGPSTAST
jgi:predicted anti-sigma-YlaC factor YlaD